MLIQGDCLKVIRELEDSSIDTIVADPPNNVPVNHFVSDDKRWHRKWADVSILTHWWEYVAKELFRVLKPTGHIFVFCNAAFYSPMYTLWDKTALLVWDKTIPGYGYIWRRQHELIITGRNKGCYKRRSWGDGDVLQYKIVPASKRLHPAEKPVELLRELIRTVTPTGGTVLDPFAGSGATLAAAKQEECDFIGIEIDSEYIKGAAKRLDETIRLYPK